MDLVVVEGKVLWGVFIALFLGLGFWEGRAGFRPLLAPAERRWMGHGLLLVAGMVVQSLVFRGSVLVVAIAVEGRDWGLLNRPELPYGVRFGLTILLLDLANYWGHRLYHLAPLLWRMHEVHHSDSDYDVSTALRFHPLEVLAAKAVRVGAVLVLAPPVAAVFAAELLAEIVNLVAHANIRLGGERFWRRWLITPDLHRIHHSQNAADYGSNFGQTFSVWDRIFGTFRGEPALGEAGLAIGVAGRNCAGIWEMLAAPFRRR